MHQKRHTVTKKIPIPRKGNTFVVRPLSHLNDSVPVLVALRDMLGLAQTAKEVKKLLNQKAIKLNGREVKDYRESIKIFNVLEADKTYFLELTPHGRFNFVESKTTDRPAKVVNKSIFKGKKTQLNLHDGSNILSEDNINVQDTVYLDSSNKIKKHVSFENGKPCFIISGRFAGNHGTIVSVENGKAKVKLKESDLETDLDKRRIIAL